MKKEQKKYSRQKYKNKTFPKEENNPLECQNM